MPTVTGQYKSQRVRLNRVPRRVCEEPVAVRRLLIGIAIAFLTIFLVLPLAVVFQQALAQAIGALAGAFQRIGVVVHLDVADAVIGYQAFDDAIEIAAHVRIAKVE